MRPFDFNGSIGRTNDFTQIKHAEDVKPIVEQQNMAQAETKRVENRAQQVNEQENADMESQYDAQREGKGTYEEQQNKRRKKQIEDEGIVSVKKQARFDIKI